MLVLDDVFSALDRETSWSILRRLVGPCGILRERGITVMLATHACKMR
jgi:ABC-type methionine transport system ATPase subunit